MGIGARIKKIREGFGTQEAFSRAVGVTRQSVANWETERVSVPVETLVKMCELGNVSIEWLATGKETKKDDIVMDTYNKLDTSSQKVVLRLLLRLATNGDEDEVLPLPPTIKTKRSRKDNGSQ